MSQDQNNQQPEVNQPKFMRRSLGGSIWVFAAETNNDIAILNLFERKLAMKVFKTQHKCYKIMHESLTQSKTFSMLMSCLRKELFNNRTVHNWYLPTLTDWEVCDEYAQRFANLSGEVIELLALKDNIEAEHQHRIIMAQLLDRQKRFRQMRSIILSIYEGFSPKHKLYVLPLFAEFIHRSAEYSESENSESEHVSSLSSIGQKTTDVCMTFLSDKPNTTGAGAGATTNNTRMEP